VIVSGDSDFSPLVSKLKELGKHVIGLGLADATSALLRDNCDEFIYYEDLDRAPIIPVEVNDDIPEKKRKGFALLLDSLLALRRENKETIYSSMVKDTMKRKKPSFNEGYYGYRTFSELLEDAQREGLLELEKHKANGTYVVTRFGLEMKNGTAGSGSVQPPKSRLPDNRPPRQERTERQERSPSRNERQERPPVRPVPPKPTAPEPKREAPEPVARPLGRDLVEDVDILDDVDDVPSYMPRKPVEPKKEVKPEAKPAPKPAPPAKPAQTTKQSREKPAERPRRQAETRPKPQPPAQPQPRPKPKPPVDEDDYSAGLGD
jgi:hypothetical protein